MHLEIRPEERLEEAETLDVIHVQVGQQDVDPGNVALDRISEGADPSPRIENEQASVGGPYFDAGGVASVVHRLCPGRRQRTPCSPERHLHDLPISQKKPEAPSIRPLCPINGIAVHSTFRCTPSTPVSQKRRCAGSRR